MNPNHIKELSIQISLNGLSFCILNRTKNSIEYLHHIEFEKKSNPYDTLEALKTGIETHPELSQPFKSVLLIYQNELSNMVPKELFDESQSADYLKFNTKILKTDFISHDEIAFNESINVYVPYININNYIFETFGEFEYKHASTILVDTLLQQKTISNTATVYINLNVQHFELIVIQKAELLLYNSFEYSSKEDVIYFLLFTMEQLKLDPERVAVKLMGKIDKGDELFDIIYTYVRFVDFYEPNYIFEFNENSNPITRHHDVIILNSF